MKVFVAQSNVVFDDPARNLEKAKSWIGSALGEGADLVLLPECFLTGYCVDSKPAAEAVAMTCHADAEGNVIAGAPEIWALRDEAANREVSIVVGAAVLDGKHLYNASLLFTPEGAVKRYCKTHLPYLGLDRFVEPGNSFPVFDIPGAKVGMLICFDIRVPEAARILALNEADIILLPTNWPDTAFASADIFPPARAAENKVFVFAANRVGSENGFKFFGRSGAYGVGGETLAKLGDEEGWFCVEIDPSLARDKRNVTIPGKHETTVFECRRPELYRDLLMLG